MCLVVGFPFVVVLVGFKLVVLVDWLCVVGCGFVWHCLFCLVLCMLFTVRVVILLLLGWFDCVNGIGCISLRCWCLLGLLLVLVWCYWFGCWNVLFPIGVGLV